MDKAELTALAEGIVAHMPGWSIVQDDYEHGLNLADAEGRKLWLCTTWAGKGRLHIAGRYPEDDKRQCYGRRVIRYDHQLPSITVAENKSAKQIAGDIARRLLPDVIEIHAKALALKQQNDAYANKSEQLRQRLKAVSPLLRDHGQEREGLDWYTDGNGYGM